MPRRRKLLYSAAPKADADSDDENRNSRDHNDDDDEADDDAKKKSGSHRGKKAKNADKVMPDKAGSSPPAESSSDSNYSPTRQLRDRKRIAKPESYVTKYAVERPTKPHSRSNAKASSSPSAEPPVAKPNDKAKSQLAVNSAAESAVKSGSIVTKSPHFLIKTKPPNAEEKPSMLTGSCDYSKVKITTGPPFSYCFKALANSDAHVACTPSRITTQLPFSVKGLLKLQTQYAARRMILSEAPACSLPPGVATVAHSGDNSAKAATFLKGGSSASKAGLYTASVDANSSQQGKSSVPFFGKKSLPQVPIAAISRLYSATNVVKISSNKRKRSQNNNEDNADSDTSVEKPIAKKMESNFIQQQQQRGPRAREASPDDIEIIDQQIRSASPIQRALVEPVGGAASQSKLQQNQHKPYFVTTAISSSVPTNSETPPPVISSPTNNKHRRVQLINPAQPFFNAAQIGNFNLAKRSSTSRYATAKQPQSHATSDNGPRNTLLAADSRDSPPRIASSYMPAAAGDSKETAHAATTSHATAAVLTTGSDGQRVVYKSLPSFPNRMPTVSTNNTLYPTPVSDRPTNYYENTNLAVKGLDATVARSLFAQAQSHIPSDSASTSPMAKAMAFANSLIAARDFPMSGSLYTGKSPPKQQQRAQNNSIPVHQAKPSVQPELANNSMSGVVRQVNFVAYTPPLEDEFWTIVRNGLKRALPNLAVVDNERACVKFLNSQWCYEDLNFRLERPLQSNPLYSRSYEFYTLPRSLYRSAYFCEHRHASLIEMLIKAYSIFTTNCALVMYQHFYPSREKSLIESSAADGRFYDEALLISTGSYFMQAVMPADDKPEKLSLHVPALRTFCTRFGSLDVFVDAMRDAALYQHLLAELLSITLHCSWYGLEQGICVSGLQTGLDDVISDDNAADDLKQQRHHSSKLLGSTSTLVQQQQQQQESVSSGSVDNKSLNTAVLQPALYKKMCSSLSFVQLVESSVRSVLNKKSLTTAVSNERAVSPERMSTGASPNAFSPVTNNGDNNNNNHAEESAEINRESLLKDDADEECMTLFYWYILLRAFSNNLCTLREYQRNVGRCQQMPEALLKWLAITDPEYLSDFVLCETPPVGSSGAGGPKNGESSGPLEYEFTLWINLIEQSAFSSDCWPSDTRIRFVSFLLVVIDMVVPEIHTLTLQLERSWQDIRRRITVHTRQVNLLKNSIDTQERTVRRAMNDKRIGFMSRRIDHEQNIERLQNLIDAFTRKQNGEEMVAEQAKNVGAFSVNTDAVSSSHATAGEFQQQPPSPVAVISGNSAALPPMPTDVDNKNQLKMHVVDFETAADLLATTTPPPPLDMDTVRAELDRQSSLLMQLEEEVEVAVGDVALASLEPIQKTRDEMEKYRTELTVDENFYSRIVYVRNLVRCNMTFLGIDRHFNHYALLEQLDGHPVVVIIRKDVEPSPSIEGNCLSHTTATVAPVVERDPRTNTIQRRVRVKQNDTAYGDLSYYPDSHLQMWHFARTQPANPPANVAVAESPAAGNVPQFKLTRASRLALAMRARLFSKSRLAPTYFEADRARDRFHFDQMELYAQTGKVFDLSERDQVYRQENVKFHSLSVIPLEAPPQLPLPQRVPVVKPTPIAVTPPVKQEQAPEASRDACEINDAATPKPADVPFDDADKSAPFPMETSTVPSGSALSAAAGSVHGSTVADDNADAAATDGSTSTAAAKADVADDKLSSPGLNGGFVNSENVPITGQQSTTRDDGTEKRDADELAEKDHSGRNRDLATDAGKPVPEVASVKQAVAGVIEENDHLHAEQQNSHALLESAATNSVDKNVTELKSNYSDSVKQSASHDVVSTSENGALAEESTTASKTDESNTHTKTDILHAASEPQEPRTPNSSTADLHVKALNTGTMQPESMEVAHDADENNLICKEKGIDLLVASTAEVDTDAANVSGTSANDDIVFLEAVEKLPKRPPNACRTASYMETVKRFALSLNRKGVRERVLFDGFNMFALPRMAMMHTFYETHYAASVSGSDAHAVSAADSDAGLSTSLSAMLQCNALSEKHRAEFLAKKPADAVELLNDLWLRSRFETFDAAHRLMLRRYNAVLDVLFARMPELGRRHSPNNISSVLLLFPLPLDEWLLNVDELSLLEFDFFRLWAHRLQCISAALTQYKTLDERRVQRLFSRHLNDVIDLVAVTEFRILKYRLCHVAVYFMSIMLENLKQIMENEPATVGACEENEEIDDEKLTKSVEITENDDDEHEPLHAPDLGAVSGEELKEEDDAKQQRELQEKVPMPASYRLLVKQRGAKRSSAVASSSVADPGSAAVKVGVKSNHSSSRRSSVDSSTNSSSVDGVAKADYNLAPVDDEAVALPNGNSVQADTVTPPVQSESAGVQQSEPEVIAGDAAPSELQSSSESSKKKHKHRHHRHHKRRHTGLSDASDGGLSNTGSSSSRKKHKKRKDERKNSDRHEHNERADRKKHDRKESRHRRREHGPEQSNTSASSSSSVADVVVENCTLVTANGVDATKSVSNDAAENKSLNATMKSGASLVADASSGQNGPDADVQEFFSNDGRPLRLTSKRAGLLK